MYNINTIFTNFGQNSAEFYDNHILLSMICIFCSEFGLKRCYFALLLTENGKDLPIVALYPNMLSTLLISILSKGGKCVKNFSVFRWM